MKYWRWMILHACRWKHISLYVCKVHCIHATLLQLRHSIMRYEYEPNQFTKVNSTSCDDSMKHLQGKYIRQRCGSLGAKLREDQYIIAYIVTYMARSFQENVFVLLTSIPHYKHLKLYTQGRGQRMAGAITPSPPPVIHHWNILLCIVSCEWGHLGGYTPYIPHVENFQGFWRWRKDAKFNIKKIS